MGKRSGYYEDEDDSQERLEATAARHGYRLQVGDGDDEVHFVDVATGEVGVRLCWEEVAYNLEEFHSGDLMNGGRDLVHDPERFYGLEDEE